MKIIVTISRILVGSLFIVSGLIKMNDAMGFMYKLEEYFEPGALNLMFLADFALPLAVFIVVAEVLLGVALLVGALPKLTSSLTLVLMLFFTWLTYYTHNCDPFAAKEIVNEMGQTVEIANQCVLECGCFGNAIPLTPYESFLKDLFLLIFVIPIVIGAFTNKISLNSPKESIIIYAAAIIITMIFAMKMLDWMFPPLFTAFNLAAAAFIQRRVNGRFKEWAMAIGVLVVCGAFQYSTLAHLPMKDYRPYAIGENITKNMMSAEDLGLEGPQYANEYTFKNKATQKDTIVLSNDWLKIYKEPWFVNNYEQVSFDGAEVKIKDGYEAPIKDFQLINYEGDDLTYSILDEDRYVFLQIMKSIDDAPITAQPKFTALANDAMADGNLFYAVTNGLYEEAEEFRHEHQCQYPFLNCDQTELKIVVRSNPGLVLLKKGTVIAKWAWRDVPDYKEVKEKYMK